MVLSNFSARRSAGRGDARGAAARRRLRGSVALAATAVAAVLLAVSPHEAAATVPTVRLFIAHVAAHCHVWRTARRTLGPSTRLVVTRGTRLVIRADCPMDFDFAQTAGPRLALGGRRTYAGIARTIVFRKAGVYRLVAKNVQTPEERGLVTIGLPNLLRLTVIVR